MTRAGAAHGLAIDFAGRTGSTRDSHKLIALAGRRAGPDAQGRLVERLFRGAFEQGGDISDPAFLAAAAAAELAVDEAEVLRWLREEEVGDEVDALARRAVEQHISAVPCFQIQRRYRVGGLQEPDVFLKVFDKIREEKRETPPKEREVKREETKGEEDTVMA